MSMGPHAPTSAEGAGWCLCKTTLNYLQRSRWTREMPEDWRKTSWGRRDGEWTQALSSGVQCQDERQRAQTGKQEIPSEHQETLYCEVEKTLAQVVQSSWVFLHGDLQKLSGHHPGQAALGCSVWPVGLDQMVSRGPFQSQTVCNSAILRNNAVFLLSSKVNFKILWSITQRYIFSLLSYIKILWGASIVVFFYFILFFVLSLKHVSAEIKIKLMLTWSCHQPVCAVSFLNIEGSKQRSELCKLVLRFCFFFSTLAYISFVLSTAAHLSSKKRIQTYNLFCKTHSICYYLTPISMFLGFIFAWMAF